MATFLKWVYTFENKRYEPVSCSDSNRHSSGSVFPYSQTPITLSDIPPCTTDEATTCKGGFFISCNVWYNIGMKTFDEYDWSMCVFPKEYMKTLFEYAQSHQFKNGLEIGFDAGCSALAFLRACPEAHLYSIDIADSLQAATTMIQEQISDWEQRHLISLRTDSTKFLPVLNQDGHKFDFIYVDGDHNYGGTLEDITNSAKLLVPGGYMIVDDCDQNHSHFGTYKAMRDFLDSTEIKFSAEPLEGSPSKAMVLIRI